IVAIVGRPNVGKSTLFNRLAGKALAIVHDAPGVTRDRNYVDTQIGGRYVTLVDTGGFDPTTDDPMGQGIARHVEAAIREADIVVCVLDGSASPTQPDRDAVHLLRRSHKPVLYVANKIDGASKELGLAEIYELGVGDVIPVSALHGRHTGKLEAAIAQALPKSLADDESEDEDGLLRIALVGRPNAGKSSLFNRLSGSERSLGDNRPGTTRDPVDSIIEWKGEKIKVIDTAGIRRKAKVERGVEAESVIRSIRMVSRANVIILMCDITEGIAEQDARLLGLCAERGRSIVVALNKVDLVRPDELKELVAEAAHQLHFATWAPIVHVSAKSGHGVSKLIQTVKTAGEEMQKRIGTSELNRFFETVLAKHPPPTRSGKAPRIYYITQTNTRPPTFVGFSSSPEHVAESYRRFVINQIRKQFGYTAVPVRLYFRGKDRDEPGSR
ncbi:MAG: ribosome biogenesis GTPase Der, partial [Polyangiaceae bacterium]|nr:ribosome biogenesis GTPase Der [Polyangiaceae bacterium]